MYGNGPFHIMFLLFMNLTASPCSHYLCLFNFLMFGTNCQALILLKFIFISCRSQSMMMCQHYLERNSRWTRSSLQTFNSSSSTTQLSSHWSRFPAWIQSEPEGHNSPRPPARSGSFSGILVENSPGMLVSFTVPPWIHVM